jgi:hypothetical protein
MRKVNMRALIIVTDDTGNTWEFELPLRKNATGGVSLPSANDTKRERKRNASNRKSAAPGSAAQAQHGEAEIDLSLPLRPFMNRYGRGSSGPRKFVLLVAHNTKGDIAAEVPSSEIQKQWAKMTGLLGEFNGAFTTRAKDNGWVDSPKFGVYKLLAGWKAGVENG